MSETLPPEQAPIPGSPESFRGNLGHGSVPSGGEVISYVVLDHSSPDLEGSAVRRLQSGVVLLSHKFPDHPSTNEKILPSKSEVVVFLAAAEQQANNWFTAPRPSALWHRRGRQEEAEPIEAMRRQKKVENTQRKLARLGFSIGITINPPDQSEQR